MSEYKHGAYAVIEPTTDYVSQKKAGTMPVYIGRAPVNQIGGETSPLMPVLINSFNDAVTKIGYSDDWVKFELCEAVFAHFKNNVQSTGPIILINVLDKTKHKSETETSAELTISKGKGEIISSTVILDTIKITGKTAGVDFAVKYSADGKKVVITDLKDSLVGKITVTFFEVTPEIVDSTDVVVAIETMIPQVYPMLNLIPTIFCSPKWSADMTVYESMCATAKLINGHWYAFVNSDLPADENVNTVKKAIDEKKKRNYINVHSSICWPMVKRQERIFHLSTLTTVTMQMIDSQNENIPYESPSNKKLDITGMCIVDGKDISFDQIEGNELNSQGIRTATYWGGKFVLWGSHTAPYVFGEEMDPKDQFDCSVRVLQYIANDFQLKYGDIVDQPMRRSLIDTIINDYQAVLDSFIQQGAVLSANISFEESENPVNDIINGDFVFDIGTTTTPPAKSITAKIRYNTSGISVLYGGDE